MCSIYPDLTHHFVTGSSEHTSRQLAPSVQSGPRTRARAPGLGSLCAAPDQPRQPGAGRRARGQLRLRHAHQRDQRDHQQVRKIIIRNIFMCISIIFPKILQIFLLCLKIFLLLPARHSPRPSTWPSPAASTRTAELILQVWKQ